MNAKIDLIGCRFGLLVVASEEQQQRNPSGSSFRRLRCRCECGNYTTVRASNLRSGKTTSCGCVLLKAIKRSKTRHGESRLAGHTAEYLAWLNMKQRCYGTYNSSYENYGGRGIRVCDRWRHSYEKFVADMGRKPGPDYSIDRIDVNGHYEPENCRWATRAEQSKNRRPFRPRGARPK